MSKLSLANPAAPIRHLLIFKSLFHSGRSCAFPCDAAGHVDLDALSETARENYLFARTVVGREYSRPAVVDAARDPDSNG